jgi:hypothetical protein
MGYTPGDMLLALFTSLLLWSAPQEPVRQPLRPPVNEQQEPPRAPGARRALAGLSGFRSESTLTFHGRSELPKYSLETTYVFPERVRWRLTPLLEEKEPAGRSLRYQFGLGVWELPAAQSRSVAHVGEEARRFRLQNELRRIAMTWPAGLEWEHGEDARLRCELAELGSVEAVVAEPDGRPTLLLSFLPESDEAFEGLEDIVWRQSAQDERWWPRSWTLTSAGQPIWMETIDQVHTGHRYLETFFLPADQRLASADLARPSSIHLSERVSRSFPLPPDLAWPEALRRGDAAVMAARRELGSAHRVNPRPAFLLDAQGLPTAFELQLIGAVESPPEGWSRSAACSAWSLVLTDLDSLSSSLLEALGGQLESGQRPGKPFVRVQYEQRRVGLVQLILPIQQGE